MSEARISRQHARIYKQNDTWIIENLSQSSYITVNKQHLSQGRLEHNSEVFLGEFISFVFLLLPEVSYTTQPTELLLPEQTLIKPTAELSTTLHTAAHAATVPPIPNNAPLSIPNSKPLVPKNIPATLSPSETIIAPAGVSTQARLVVSSNIHSDIQSHILNKAEISLGRDRDNQIIIADPIISSKHAQLIREGEHWVLIHPHPSRQKTLNGLWYQGQLVRGDQAFRKTLLNGDIFRIGDEHGTLITLTFEDGKGHTAALPFEMEPIVMNSSRLTIGRIPENTIVLNHPQVSAHHALLEKLDNGYRLNDMNSTNHVYVNGEPINSQILHTGDEIRIGPYRLTFTGTMLKPYDESNTIQITAHHLKKRGNNQVLLLQDISLLIPPRKFVALVGGSGAGKSTLMDALNGLRPAQDGSVLYNGIDYYHNLAAFKTLLGYVPQEDIVHRDLTVERALYYAARLRLPSDFTQEQIEWRIAEVLEDVEMSERRTLLINKLSGGQRKRVSIALELLANPSVFFLDEPTSGLDPGLDRKMMMLLRRLADRGRTIVLVTHATNNINTCDYVCFLAQGGHLAYFGPPNDAKAYFHKTDFAEIYSTLEATKEAPDIPQQAGQRFLASADYQRYVAKPIQEMAQDNEAVTTTQKSQGKQMHTRHGHGWSQFLLLSTRYLELLKNDTGNLLILLLQAPIIALMLVLMLRFEIGTGVFDANKLVRCSTQILTPSGPLALPQAQSSTTIDCSQVVAFLQTNTAGQAYAKTKGDQAHALQDFLLPGPGADAQKALFIMAFATILFGCINGTREIVKEAAIYQRERAVNLGILPYMFSKIVVLGLLCLFQSAILTLVVEIGEPLQQGIFLSPILETYITLALTSLTGLMIGLTISAVAPNNDRAISFVPIILLPQVIFSGAIIPLKDWFTQILATVFPSRWAMVSLGSSIGLHAESIGNDKLFGNDYSYHSTLYSIYTKTDAIHRLLLSWGALVALLIVLTLVIGICLKRKDIRV